MSEHFSGKSWLKRRIILLLCSFFPTIYWFWSIPVYPISGNSCAIPGSRTVDGVSAGLIAYHVNQEMTSTLVMFVMHVSTTPLPDIRELPLSDRPWVGLTGQCSCAWCHAVWPTHYNLNYASVKSSQVVTIQPQEVALGDGHKERIEHNMQTDHQSEHEERVTQ